MLFLSQQGFAALKSTHFEEFLKRATLKSTKTYSLDSVTLKSTDKCYFKIDNIDKLLSLISTAGIKSTKF